MDICKLTERVQFGVASPPYQSRSAGTDFEDLIKQLREELKTIEMYCTQNSLSSDDLLSNQILSLGSNLVSLPQLLSMDEMEYSLLDELLMSALEETRLTTHTNSSEDLKNDLESQVSDRFKLDISKMGKVLKHGL